MTRLVVGCITDTTIGVRVLQSRKNDVSPSNLKVGARKKDSTTVEQVSILRINFDHPEMDGRFGAVPAERAVSIGGDCAVAIRALAELTGAVPE
jgi:hypothetical protein